MWKAYAAENRKQNRTSGSSIMAAAFIAALFLSFLCSMFYNFWLDNVEGTKLEDGDWHGRITGEISTEDIAALNSFANVEKVAVNEELSEGQKTVVDIWFRHKRTVYQDILSLVKELGLEENAADYNYQLLSLYFIRIPGDGMPRLILPLYLALVALVCFSLVLVIHNAFAVSMNSRVHQFGIFSSIGATPAQIRVCLVQEAFILTLGPVCAGLLSGFVLSFVTVRAMGTFASELAGGRQVVFGWHPAVFIFILLLSFLTVLVSAWLPARKLSRLTPLEAIRGTDGLCLKKGKNSFVLSALFGMEGELAGNAMRAQKKALRTTSLSLTFAFLGFMLMQCFFTLSGISTDHTYFERYQDAWDVMVTIKDTRIEDFTHISEIQGLQEGQTVTEVRSSVVYQKAETLCVLPREAISAELLELGGPEAVAGPAVSAGKDFFIIKAPIVILDDNSFEGYCRQIGMEPEQNGTILLNRIWDSVNSNFRYPEYVPYLQETGAPVTLLGAAREGYPDSLQDVLQEEGAVEIPVLAYTCEYPALREEYDNYALVNFMPLSLWREISEHAGGAEKDTYIRILANEGASLDELEALEEKAALLAGAGYELESENRIREKLLNDDMIGGYEMVLGAFCVLLAVIGVAHVFSSTLGFLYQRRREFARYLSVGLTPGGLRKLFCLEALMLAGRPVLVTLILTTAATAAMIKASYLDPVEFIVAAPVKPIILFILAVSGFVALAYFLGGRRVLRSNLMEALRDDTMI